MEKSIPIGGYAGKIEAKIVIHFLFWLCNKTILDTKGSDGAGPSDGFTEVDIDWRTSGGLYALQLAGGGDVESLWERNGNIKVVSWRKSHDLMNIQPCLAQGQKWWLTWTK